MWHGNACRREAIDNTCKTEARNTSSMKFAGPLAQGVSDPGHDPINQKINHSINSWFLVLGFWCLGLGSYCFFDSPGAHMGVRQGGFHGDVPTLFGTWTPLQLRLKIALVFDTLFVRFWLHLGCQDDHQNPQKSFKSRVRNCTAF